MGKGGYLDEGGVGWRVGNVALFLCVAQFQQVIITRNFALCINYQQQQNICTAYAVIPSEIPIMRCLYI